AGAAGKGASHRADAIPVGLRSFQLDPQTVIRPPFVWKKVSPAAGRSEKDIQRAVVIDVGISRAPRDFRAGEHRAESLCDLLKLSAAQIAEQMRRLGVAHPFLHALDFIFNVAVGDENVRPAVVVVIEKEAAKTQRDQTGAAELG